MSIFAGMFLERVRGIGFASEAIFENEGGNAKVVEVFGGFTAFGFEDKLAMAATGKDQDGSAVGLFFWRQEDGQGRVVNIMD